MTARVLVSWNKRVQSDVGPAMVAALAGTVWQPEGFEGVLAELERILADPVTQSALNANNQHYRKFSYKNGTSS